MRCCLREGLGGGRGTRSDPLDGAAGERALHGCRWRERVEMERGSADRKREREASWLGSLLRAVPFGRGKREKSGGFARLWKRKKIRGKRKKRKKERERKV